MGWWTARAAEARRGREAETLRQEVARLESMPESPRTLTALGRLHEWLDDPHIAVATYRRALEVSRESGEPRWRALHLEARIAACGDDDPPEPVLEIRHGDRTTMVSAAACVLGRSARTADVCIPASTVAHAHCALWCEDGAWYVRDLGSTNGTRLDGSEVGEEQRLDARSLLELAEERVVVRVLARRDPVKGRTLLREVGADGGVPTIVDED